MALATFIPPPPGSSFGAEHFNFFSGTRAGIEVLLSMHGLNVIVIIFGIALIHNLKLN